MTDLVETKQRTGGKSPPTVSLPVPPTDVEKLSYIRGRQHRWFWWAHFVAFCGLAASLYGFSRMAYWTLIFLIPLGIYATETLLGLWTSTFERRVSLPDHEAIVQLWQPEQYPSVDIFITTLGEGAAILSNTFRYVDTIKYPGEVTTYVLDDAADPAVRQAAARYGFEYIARPGNEFKKAGNLQYAFERTSGDRILILDADFVPRHDVLTELLPHMETDPRIGIVQSAQFYPSRIKGMGWIERCASATQEVFYRFIQPSRDAVEATICCGTSALYRRSALEKTNGFPQVAHSEDMFTGFDLLEHGYRTAYVPINVTQGLCPATIDPFISQQYRWCAGSAELLKMRKFHEHPDVTTKQRASFWSGYLYYLTTAMNGFFAPIPLLVMVWKFPQYVHPSNVYPLLGLVALWLFVYPLLLKSKWRLDVLRVQTIYSFAHAVAIYDTFFGTQAEWVPSNGKNRAAPLAIRVKRIMGGYLAVTFTAVLVGVAYRLSERQYTLANWWALIALMTLNLYVFAPVVWKCLSTLHADRKLASADATRVTIVIPDQTERAAASEVVSVSPAAHPAWRMAVASFLPSRRRERAVRSWIGRLPLLVILGLQALTSLRLSNSAFQDEALYISYGHWMRTGDLAANHIQPARFFSGAPQLYPLFSSYLDSAGGLALVRLFSTLCMLSCTVAVYWMTRALFAHRAMGQRPAIFAALVFSISAPVIFLGNFATFDAPAFTCIAWASALAVWSSRNVKSLRWSLLIGALSALAIALKYSSAIDVPIILLLTLAGWSIRSRRRLTLTRGVIAGLATVGLLGISALTWARSDLVGLKVTTTERSLAARTPELTLVHDVFTWSGLSIVLMILGGIYLMPRQPKLAVVLLVGLVAAVGFQIHTGELTSLHKHVVLGLLFGAPLAGLLLARISTLLRPLGILMLVTTAWITLLLGLFQSASLFRTWSNTTGLVQTLQYSFNAMPYVRVVGDIPEPVQYGIRDAPTRGSSPRRTPERSSTRTCAASRPTTRPWPTGISRWLSSTAAPPSALRCDRR